MFLVRHFMKEQRELNGPEAGLRENQSGMLI